MKKCLDYLMSQARKFTAVDFVFFKLTLISAGILLGSYFATFFQGFIAFVWLLFVVSYTATIFATFRKR